MMGGNPGLDNGEWMMRAQRQAINQYTRQDLAGLAQQQNPYLAPRGWTPGERPEPEDTTGLKMLDEFLAKRKGERDGDERK